VLAYIAWHLPAPAVRAAAFEQALERFHRSLAHRPPSGFRGSAAFRARGLPWLAHDTGPGPDPVSGGSDPVSCGPGPVSGGPGPVSGEPGADSGDAGPVCGYEDWYLVDGWSAVGVLEEAAVARGHQSSHAAVAAMTGVTTGAIYRLIEGLPRLERAPLAVWVKRSPGHAPVTIEDLLADGIEGDAAGLWRRCLGLGPAPEYCLLAAQPPAGVSPSRLPAGWRATAISRELVWSG
jgi:hypothetical protein